MRYRQLGFLFLALLLAACGGQLATDSGVSGTWTGQITEGEIPITFTLSQTGTTVQGELTVRDTAPAPLTGTAISNTGNARIIVSLSGRGSMSSIQIEASAEGSAMRGTIAATQGEMRTPLAFTATR